MAAIRHSWKKSPESRAAQGYNAVAKFYAHTPSNAPDYWDARILNFDKETMMDSDVNRRDFNKLTVAAVTGMLAGAAGCSGDSKTEKLPTPDLGKPEGSAASKPEPAAGAAGNEKVAAAEVHLCRGLNACKGHGGGKAKGENACAGQGDCATVKEHSCGGDNECKGLGGCGATAGANECKGKGGCHVPLMDEAWKTVRAAFEKKMTSQGKKFGNPPDKG